MAKNIFFKIGIGVFAFMLLLLLLTKIVVEPWIEKKIEVTLNEKYSEYIFEIGKVNISLPKFGMAIEYLKISSRNEEGGNKDLTGEITSIKLKGINLSKMVFKKDMDIGK
jgi:hypothetical protein